MTNDKGPQPLEQPFIVGPYLVTHLLGAGGMGAVYLGTHQVLGQQRALKRPFIFDSDPAARESFINEARRQAAMQHPNIAILHEFLEHEGQLWIVMEYFSPGTVRPLVGHLSDQQVVLLLTEVLSALAHAHGKQVVHRDIKPENLMRTNDGRVKVTDFGIARAFDEQRGTKSGWFRGDPHEVAPEVVAGEDAGGPAADLYAVGAVAYLFCTGEEIFAELPAEKVPIHKVSHPAPSVAEYTTTFDPAIIDCVDQLLERDPQRRPASAADVVATLEGIAERQWGPRWRDASLPVEVSAEVTPPERIPPPRLVSVSTLKTYAPISRLVRNAMTDSRVLMTLLGSALLAVLAVLLMDTRPGWVVAGAIIAVAGVGASVFFDERTAFKVGRRLKPTVVGPAPA